MTGKHYRDGHEEGYILRAKIPNIYADGLIRIWVYKHHGNGYEWWWAVNAIRGEVESVSAEDAAVRATMELERMARVISSISKEQILGVTE